MITVTRRATPPVPDATGTWWDYELATRSGVNRMRGCRQGTRKSVETYLRGVLRHMERVEHPFRKWSAFQLKHPGRERPLPY